MDRFRLKNDAKNDIRGKLWLALQPLIIILLISYVIGIFSTLAGRALEAGNRDLYTALTVIYSILSFVYAVVYFSLYVGTCKYYLGFVTGNYMSWTVIFEVMKNGKRFWQQFLCYLITDLIIVAGTICFIIPGIYFAFRYSMIGYVYAENPDRSWKDVAKRSADLMDGHYFEYFCLIFSFFFWWCLVAITFGIASIYVVPYMQCTTARYYKALKYLKEGHSAAGTASSRTDPYPFSDSELGRGEDTDVKYPFDID